MKRCIILLYILSCMYINLSAQLSDKGLYFWGKYGGDDINNLPEDYFFAQDRSSSNCHTNEVTRGKEYSHLFIPTTNEAIMNVRINLIFIQKDDGTGNFQEDNIEHQALFDDIMNALNNKTSQLTYPGTDCFTGTESEIIHDIKIRFVDHRYYIKNDSLWNNNLFINNTNLCPGAYYWYLSGVDDSLNNVLGDTLKGINIYYTEDSTLYNRFWEISDLTDTMSYGNNYTNGACSMFPNYQNWNASSRIHMPCMYSKFWRMKNIVPQLNEFNQPSWENEVRSWLVDGHAAGLLHELGHSFYLLHPKDDYNRSYHSYPLRDCWYSIMQPNGSSPRNFLPPQEIGLMYLSTMTTNLQQFVPFNTYLGSKTINTTISLPQMRMYYSLIIGSLGNVTIPCDMIFSPQGYIDIQNGGLLSINGASLLSTNNSWCGIRVLSGGTLILSDVSINEYDIVVKNGGCLIINDDLTIVGNHSITIENGGYICIENSALVNLADEFSIITIAQNAILGCLDCSDNCISSCSDLTNSGNGHFVIYEGTKYVQDTTITSNYLVFGDTVYAGYDVTTTEPEGNVTVENGGELRIKANETTLTKDVEIKLGGTLIISK